MERPVCFRDSGLQTGVRRRKYKLKLGPTKQLVSDPDVVQMEREAQADTLRSGTATSLLVDCTTKMLNKEHCKLNVMLDYLLERRKPASLNRGDTDLNKAKSSGKHRSRDESAGEDKGGGKKSMNKEASAGGGESTSVHMDE